MMDRLMPRLEKWAETKFGLDVAVYGHQVQMTGNRGRPDGLLVGPSPALQGGLMTIAVEGKSTDTQRDLLSRIDLRQPIGAGALLALLVGTPVAWFGGAVYAAAAASGAGLVAGLLARESATYADAVDQAAKYPANVNLLALPHILVLSDWWDVNGQELLRLARRDRIGVIVPTADSLIELTAPVVRPGNYLKQYCAAEDFLKQLSDLLR